MRPEVESGVFYYLTDREIASRIADVGFLDSGRYDGASTVTLLDHVPPQMGGGIVRVILPEAETEAALHREASDHGEGYRKFLVPMELLTHANVVVEDVSTPDASAG